MTGVRLFVLGSGYAGLGINHGPTVRLRPSTANPISGSYLGPLPTVEPLRMIACLVS